jgi:hypothetical protein
LLDKCPKNQTPDPPKAINSNFRHGNYPSEV